MFDLKVLIVLATCLSWSYCKLDTYCSLCQDHTMCKFNGIGPNCSAVGGSGVTENEKQIILDVHNWLRRIVATGYETRGVGKSQPKAANLRKLVWDPELEKVAQRWADQCRFEHDTCRNDPRFNVGQNLYWKWKYPTHTVNWTEAILSWYDEVTLYNPSEVESYRFEASTGHYTQMLWHDTHSIGCGRRDYGQNKLYVCNYGPAGNWIGEPMYAIGEPCSKCPQGTVCDEYLCAEQSKNHPNESKPPKETAKDGYASDGGKTNFQTKLNAIKEEIKKDEVVTVEKDQKTEGNTIDENEVDLDEDTLKEIEEIKLRIENLLKKVIKKQKPPRGIL